MRIGGDVRADWCGMERAVEVTMQHLFLNNVIWWTDPDVVCVRPPLTIEQARTWATLTGITGQVLMASDDMPKLPADRVELLRRLLPVADIRPMELYPLTDRHSIFDLKINLPNVGEWDVVAVFNWSREWTKTGAVSPASLGIDPNRDGYIFYDVWKERVLSTGRDEQRIRVPPMSCRVISVRRVVGRPQLVGTSRHLTQGADDLEAVAWNGRTRTLSGRSRVVGGDPYRIRFTVPRGWAVRDRNVRVSRGIGTITLRTDGNETVDWSVRFDRVG